MSSSSGRTLTAVALGAIAALARPGWSAAAAEASAVRAFAAQATGSGAGTMPLLAAMAIGIAVSVIAVLAFLQMTSRGKSTKDDDFRQQPDFAYDPSILRKIQSSEDKRADGSDAGDDEDARSDGDENDENAGDNEGARSGGDANAGNAEDGENAGDAVSARSGDDADAGHDEGFRSGGGAYRGLSAEAEAAADEDVAGYTIPLRSLGSPQHGLEPALAGEPRLVGLKGEFAGDSYRLSDRPIVIGRDGARCGLVYPEERAEISRKHCTVGYDAARRVFTLVDHGSSNGTYLGDGTRIAAEDRRELRTGERFALSGEGQCFEVKA